MLGEAISSYGFDPHATLVSERFGSATTPKPGRARPSTQQLPARAQRRWVVGECYVPLKTSCPPAGRIARHLIQFPPGKARAAWKDTQLFGRPVIEAKTPPLNLSSRYQARPLANSHGVS